MDVAAPGAASTRVSREAATGQHALVIEPGKGALPRIVYRFAEGRRPLSPDRIGSRPDNRFTRPSAELREDVRRLVAGAGNQGAALRRIVDTTAERFDYGHPEMRFNDGTDDVPLLACGLTPGSCIDINTYLVSSCLAAGIPAAYMAGYFFPAERNGITNDMHCWVVTWAGGVQQEWDIAHHIKTGIGRVQPAYNPRRGTRYAMSFGRGHRYAWNDTTVELGHVSEPEWLRADGTTSRARLTVTLGDSAIAMKGTTPERAPA